MSNDFDKKIMGYYAEIANTHGNMWIKYMACILQYAFFVLLAIQMIIV